MKTFGIEKANGKDETADHHKTHQEHLLAIKERCQAS